jgi:hypothetical protein
VTGVLILKNDKKLKNNNMLAFARKTVMVKPSTWPCDE